MKDYTNQQVRSSGIIIMLSLVGVCVAAVFFPWKGSRQGSAESQAVIKAEIAGYQVIQIYHESLGLNQKDSHLGSSSSLTNVKNNRLPASELRMTGFIGEDPWGQPYHYRILGLNEQSLKILVWSSGPNGRVESKKLDDEEWEPFSQSNLYEGDDLGTVVTVKE